MYAKYHKMFALGSDITCARSHQGDNNIVFVFTKQI